MSIRPVPSHEIQSRLEKALRDSVQHDAAGWEQMLLTLIGESSQDEDRYFLCLYYGEFLLQNGKLEEAWEILIRSARIALTGKHPFWLALSHEKLGDVLAAEEDWFGARHHYRYSLRQGATFFDLSEQEALETKANAAQEMLRTTVLSRDAKILALNKEYLAGNMAIAFVHRDIFLKNYFARCLECNFCHDWCCSFGADIDIQNVGKIEQYKEEILPFIRPSEVKWFDQEYTYYEEYAGNQYTRINTHGPRCVFISKDQRGCGLHRYALSQGMDYHEIKPLICILFPLSFEQGILSLAEELDDGSLICSGSGSSAYQSLRNELEYYFGNELVEELDELEKEVWAKR